MIELNERGITLIELVIGAALSTLIILLGSTLFINSQIDERNINQNIDIIFTTMLASKSLRHQLYTAGGATLRPWHSLAVENDCAVRAVLPNCLNTDRVTIANEMTDPVTNLFLPPHRIVSYNDASGALVIAGEDPGDGLIRCLMTAAVAGQHIAILNTTATHVYYRWVTGVDPVTCTFTTVRDQQGTILNSANANVQNYAGGLFTQVTLKTIYYDSTTRRVNRLAKRNNNLGAIGAGELITMESDVYDLQFALGYDASPANNTILRDGTTADEILYNTAGDTFAALASGKAQFSDLRMIYVALALGTNAMKREKLGNKVQFLDGPEVTVANQYLFGFERRFYLRNILTIE